jgi:hypothetical protein
LAPAGDAVNNLSASVTHYSSFDLFGTNPGLRTQSSFRFDLLTSTDSLFGDANMRIRYMDAVPFNVVETFLDIEAGLRLSPNQLNGLEMHPWPITLWQPVDATRLDNSKNAAGSSENFNEHGRLPRHLSYSID